MLRIGVTMILTKLLIHSWMTNEPDPGTDYWPLWCVYARYGGLPRLIYINLQYTSKNPPKNLEHDLEVYDQKLLGLALKIKDHSPGDFFTSDSLPHEIIVTRPGPNGRVRQSELNDPPPFSTGKQETLETSQSGIRTAYIMDMVFGIFAGSYQSKALAVYKYLSA